MICVPIKNKTISSLLNNFEIAQKEADLTEICFDELKSLKKEDINALFKKKKKPLIYKTTTFLNFKKIPLKKIDFIDIDLNSSNEIIKEIRKTSPKTRIILSYHNFKETPAPKELNVIVKKLKSKKPDIIKIATRAKTLNDSLRMLELLSSIASKGQKAICLCMGEKGILTRTSGHLFGNLLTFAPLKSSSKTAEGQLTIKDLKKYICR